MAETDLVISAGEVKRRDTFISLFLALYVFVIYIPITVLPAVLGSVVLYMYLGVTLLKMITKQTSLKITGYSVWYFCFGMLGLCSSLYALSPSYVSKDLYVLLVSWVVSFSFIQYVQSDSGFERIFFYFAYFPIPLAFYLFLSGEIDVQGERLGQTLYGNANRLAVFLMISLFCISWFLVYAKRKHLFINIVLALVMFYITALTGGRKYILMPLIFFLLLLIFKNWRNNKGGLALYLVLFALIISSGIWMIINVPSLYNAIGVRFEGLINFLEGNLTSTDDSTLMRYIMIKRGWEWFFKRPILGYGLNNFSPMSLVFQSTGSYSHNNYLEILVNLGMIGFLVYYSFYAYIMAKLIGIRNDITGLRNFFLAFMLVLLVFEIGNVTYQFLPVQIFLGLASAYVWLYENGKKENRGMRAAKPWHVFAQ